MVVILLVAGLASLGSQLAGRTPIDRVAVGGCFNGLAADDVGGSGIASGLILGVTVVDCAEPHQGELIARYGWPEGTSRTYPGDAVVASFAEDECKNHFREYVGTDFDFSRYELTYTHPQAPTWNTSRGTFECIVHPPSGEELRGSVRNTNR